MIRRHRSSRPLAAILASCLALLAVVPSPTSPQSAAPLLGASDLHYLGSFRLPAGTQGIDHFDYSSAFMAGNVYYDPARGNVPTLFISGYLSAGYVSTTPSLAQVSIPVLKDPNVVGLDRLNTATFLQEFADPSSGHTPLNGQGFCSYVVYRTNLLGFCSVAYDASGSQSTAAFVNASLNLSSPSVAGPYPVGSGALPQTFYGGYATLVPPEWQAALGAKVVMGNAPWSIISRNSAGPGLHTVDADALVGKPPAGTRIASTPLAYYWPCASGDMADPACHWSLGAWNSNLPNQTWNGIPVPTVTVTDPLNRQTPSGGPTWTIPYNESAMRIKGILFADGTSSVLFFGQKSLGPYCYGPGGASGGSCYDPDNPYKGDHGYPYSYFVWAYNVNDYVASKNDPAAHPPWRVRPYAGWAFNPYPAGGDMGEKNATGSLGGAAWDPSTRRLYLAAPYTDNSPVYGQPLIHVFQIGGGTSSAPPAAPTNLVVW